MLKLFHHLNLMGARVVEAVSDHFGSILLTLRVVLAHYFGNYADSAFAYHFNLLVDLLEVRVESVLRFKDLPTRMPILIQ